MTSGRAGPRYIQVAEELVALIRGGSYTVGGLLPAEAEICAQYDISRHTAREALRVLEQMGLVVRRRGSGSRVLARSPPLQYTQSARDLDTLLQYGDDARLQLYSSTVVEADAATATRFGVAQGTAMVHMLGLRCRQGQSAALAHSEILAPKPRGHLGELLLDKAAAATILTERLHLHRLLRVEQTFSAESLDVERARRLDAEPGSAALRIERSFFGGRATLLAHAVSTHPAGRFGYTTVLARAGA